MQSLENTDSSDWRPQDPGSSGRGWGLVALAFAITFLVCRWSGALAGAEFAVLDGWMSLRPAIQPCSSIALVGIERRDKEEYDRSRPSHCSCSTICRAEIGLAVSRIKAAGAKVVALDLMFKQMCPVYLGTASWHDRRLIDAIAAPGATVLAAYTDPTPGRVEFRPPPEHLIPETGVVTASPALHVHNGLIRRLCLIQHGALTTEDEVSLERHLVPVGRPYAPLSAAALAAFHDHPKELPELVAGDSVSFLRARVPVCACQPLYLLDALVPRASYPPNCGVMLINWVGPSGTFPMYSLLEVNRAGSQALRYRFQDKIVLVGDLSDRESTPVFRAPRRVVPPLVDQTAEPTMSGLEVHANALDTLMRHRFIHTAPAPVMWLLIFILSLLAATAFRVLGPAQAIGVTVGAVPVLFILSWALFRADYWLLVVSPSIATLLSGGVSGLWGLAAAKREATRLASQVRARDTLTSTIAHDLKQPLGAISALAAALRAQQDAGRGPRRLTPELLDRIQAQVGEALGEIDELLTVDPNRALALRLQTFDLVTLAQDLAAMRNLQGHNHCVDVIPASGPVMVKADARFLGRALANLLDNAVKYWPEGGTITVKVQSADGLAQVHVIDGGVGIPTDEQHRIFLAYERAVPEEMDVAGTGIGLYSVKRIAEAHGGTVSVHSEAGAGSRFTLSIPSQHNGPTARRAGGRT